MFEKSITRGVAVEVKSSYVEENSNPRAGQYFFSYRIRITNSSREAVQLLSRHWIIADGFGKVEEVRGPGVVGQQPRLKAGESFEYESFCPLPTPTGSMRGTFAMVTDRGEKFDVDIPQFYLIEPHSFH